MILKSNLCSYWDYLCLCWDPSYQGIMKGGDFQQHFAQKEESEVIWFCFLPPRRNLASSYPSQTKTTQETKQPCKYPLLFSKVEKRKASLTSPPAGGLLKYDCIWICTKKTVERGVIDHQCLCSQSHHPFEVHLSVLTLGDWELVCRRSMYKR